MAMENMQASGAATPVSRQLDSALNKIGVTGAHKQILALVLTPEELGDIDPFDRVQLAEVIRVCRQCRSLSEAGRVLFSVSRTKRKSTNDADRLGKYLAKFDLNWQRITGK